MAFIYVRCFRFLALFGVDWTVAFVAFIFVRCFRLLALFGVESSAGVECPTVQVDERRCGGVVWMVIRLSDP